MASPRIEDSSLNQIQLKLTLSTAAYSLLEGYSNSNQADTTHRKWWKHNHFLPI
jgi:hypothetical protein